MHRRGDRIISELARFFSVIVSRFIALHMEKPDLPLATGQTTVATFSPKLVFEAINSWGLHSKSFCAIKTILAFLWW